MLPLSTSRLGTPVLFESTLYEPWSDLRREIDRVFDTVASGVRSNGSTGQSHWTPPMDVEDHDDRIRLAFEIPGVDPDAVSVTVEDGVLTVAGEKTRERRENANGKRGTYATECRYGRFERRVALPESLDADRIVARAEHGVLTIELPKAAKSLRRSIEISRGNGKKTIESGNTGGRRTT